MFEMYDRFLARIEKIRGHWYRRDDIRENVSEGIREVPGRWKDSDRPAKLTVLVIVALCALGITLTLL